MTRLLILYWTWLHARDIRRHDARHLATYIAHVNQPRRF